MYCLEQKSCKQITSSRCGFFMNDKENITAKDQTQTKYAYGRTEKNRKSVL
jgi:hypothetical protein